MVLPVRLSEGGIKVASRVLKRTEVEAFRASITTDASSLVELTSSAREKSAFTREADGLYISTAQGLKGAKGAMVAIGLEAAAAIFLYAIWLAWHALR